MCRDLDVGNAADRKGSPPKARKRSKSSPAQHSRRVEPHFCRTKSFGDDGSMKIWDFDRDCPHGCQLTCPCAVILVAMIVDNLSRIEVERSITAMRYYQKV